MIFSAESLEAARKIFAGECAFFAGADSVSALPPAGLPEVAFAGRSNVGKSSLVNALTGRKTLARTSHTPGRTQQLNFFNLAERLVLVDMPGYGYAKVSRERRESWDHLVRGYLRARVPLRCVFLLVDARHGLKESDEEMLCFCDEAAVSVRIVLTKLDKATQVDVTVSRIEAHLKKHPAAFPHVFLTSVMKDMGIADLRAQIIALTQGQGDSVSV